jgi:hypothetical protein
MRPYFLPISRRCLEIKPLFNSRESLKNDILSSKSEEVPFSDKRDFFLVLSQAAQNEELRKAFSARTVPRSLSDFTVNMHQMQQD